MGTSWKTTILGWIIIIGDVVKLIADTASEKGVPTDLSGWITFLLAMGSGIGLILAKDYNVSNSSTDKPAHPVPGA